MARKGIGRAAVILCLACLFARLLRRQNPVVGDYATGGVVPVPDIRSAGLF